MILVSIVLYNNSVSAVHKVHNLSQNFVCSISLIKVKGDFDKMTVLFSFNFGPFFERDERVLDPPGSKMQRSNKRRDLVKSRFYLQSPFTFFAV